MRGHITSAVLEQLPARLIERCLEAAGVHQRACTALATLARIDDLQVELGARRLYRVGGLTSEPRLIGEGLRLPTPSAFRVA